MNGIATKKVSIIVPVHNAEKTLNMCVESIINQDYRPCRFSFYGNVKFLKFPQKCILKAHCGFLLVEEASENLKNFLKHLAKWAFSDSRSERNTQKSPEM